MLFDTILAAALREQGRTDMRCRCEFLDCEERDGGVHSRIRDLASGEETTVVSQYFAACDGAGSGIRRSLGIAMQGDQAINYSLAIFLRAPKLLQQHDKGQAERYIFVGPEGTWGNLTVVEGAAFWRLKVMGDKALIDEAGGDEEYALFPQNYRFQIPKHCHWQDVRVVTSNVGQALQTAMRGIEKANPET